MVKGIVFDIQKFSLYDGPGIRTTVFLKGCPLRCIWCHNPESHSLKIEHTCDFKKTYGREMGAEEIINEATKDIKYYEKSGGGLTISGGEPLSQPEFTLEILKLAKKRDIHTCIETTGYASTEVMEMLLPYVDLFLYDYKATSSEQHKRLTGAPNALILKNLQFIYEKGASIILRCPLIPGVNDSKEHLHGIAEMSNKYPLLKSIELLPYHDMGKGKYKELGREYSLGHLKNTDEKQKKKWLDFFQVQGCKNIKIG